MNRLPGLTTLSAALLLAACGGGGSKVPTSHSVSSTASLGALVGSSCEAQDIATKLKYAGTTNTDGVVVFNGVPNSAGTLIVTCTGGQYFDEAETDSTKSNKTLTVPMKSVIAPGQVSAAVTPLTNIVATLVQAALDTAATATPNVIPTFTTAQLAAVATQVADVYAPNVDILAPPKAAKSKADVDGLNGSDNSGKYAAALAALSKLAFTSGKPLEVLMQAIADDVSDRKIGNGLSSFNPSLTDLSSLNAALDKAQGEITTVSPGTRSPTGDAQAPEVTPGTPGGTGATGATGG